MQHEIGTVYTFVHIDTWLSTVTTVTRIVADDKAMLPGVVIEGGPLSQSGHQVSSQLIWFFLQYLRVSCIGCELL